MQRAANNPDTPEGARIGEVLVSEDLMNREKTNAAQVDLKQARNEKLGSMLVQRGLLSEEPLLPALAKKLNVPWFNLDKKAPTPEALHCIPQRTARKMGVVPVELRGSTLMVATADPGDQVAEKYLNFVTGRAVKMVLASSRQILDTQKIFYVEDQGNRDGLFDANPGGGDIIRAKREADSRETADATVVRLVDKLLLGAIAAGASYIHFESGPGDLVVRYRVGGECHLAYEIPASFWASVLVWLKRLAGLDTTEVKRPQRGQLFLTTEGRELEYWIETTPTVGGQEDIVLRVIENARPKALDKLGFSTTTLNKFKALLTRTHGIILCVGPEGAGKTSSLYAALKHINTPSRKIWKVEDPVEILQPGARLVQVTPQSGLAFKQVLRSFLHADPDVIMVGDIADAETAKMAIEAALAGRLVFAAMTTGRAAQTILRFLRFDVNPQDFAETLADILSQSLFQSSAMPARKRIIRVPWSMKN